jgi:hypothetical protein
MPAKVGFQETTASTICDFWTPPGEGRDHAGVTDRFLTNGQAQTQHAARTTAAKNE